MTATATSAAHREHESGLAWEGSPGVCHRCGWRMLVARIGRRERKMLMTGWLYGRLCHDCVSDLVACRALPETCK